MDLAAVNGNMDLIECASPENLVSQEASDNSGIYGEPEILPRVGDQYQVKIPSLISVSDYRRLSTDPDLLELANADSPNCPAAISIPLVWIREEAKSENESSISQCAEEASVGGLEGNGSRPKVHPIDVALTLSDGKKSSELGHSVLPQSHGGKGHSLVPGCLDNVWTDFEESGFLLGLYVFGKNLVLVKKLIGSKEMGDILSYYYGKFYRTDKYRRWSECRKIRTRRCIYGQRIFMGSRHQEFLSRLLLNESEECRFTVMEMSKAFGEGKIQLSEYVFGLKAKVGMNALVEAVGIGKGKQDLTGIVNEAPRSNHTVHVRPEIPVGKACSLLTPKEIISFLTGDFRLSKAKSNDIFWEAVWPRLLARGWHSEQPNNGNNIGLTTNPKNSLVFLVPGVKNFSRRKLVKGDHYYDSVTDVLSLVASNPSLLDIDGFKSKEENGWAEEPKLEQQEDFPNEQRHCYLKPRTPSRANDAVKFTIVDTSRVSGKGRKVRDLRSLPFEVVNTFTVLSRSSEEEEDDNDDDGDVNSCEVSDNLSLDKDMSNGLKPAMINFGKPLYFGGKVSDYDVSKLGFQVNAGALIALPAIHTGLGHGMRAKKSTKSKLNQKESFEKDKNHLAPVVKRRRRLPIPSGKETSNDREGSRLQQEIDGSDISENVPSQADPSQDKLSSPTSTSSAEGILKSSNHIGGAEESHDKPSQRTFIDLNVPISQNVEIDEVSMKDTVERQDQEMIKEPEKPPAVKSLDSMINTKQEANVGPRRQSTRNRPLTTKVLEAFACGFMDTKQKRKSKDENPKPKTPSRRTRPRVSPPENFNSVAAVSFPMEDSQTPLQSSIQNATSDAFNKLGIELKLVSERGDFA